MSEWSRDFVVTTRTSWVVLAQSPLQKPYWPGLLWTSCSRSPACSLFSRPSPSSQTFCGCGGTCARRTTSCWENRVWTWSVIMTTWWNRERTCIPFPKSDTCSMFIGVCLMKIKTGNWHNTMLGVSKGCSFFWTDHYLVTAQISHKSISFLPEGLNLFYHPMLYILME